jgi:outer membrane protein
MKNTIYKTSIILLLVFTNSYNSPAQIFINGVEDAIRIGMDNNYIVKNSILQKVAADHQQKIAKSVLAPQLKAVFTFDDFVSLPVQLIPAELLGGQEGEFRQVQFGTQYSLSGGLEASMPLINTSAWESIKQARIQQELSSTEMEIQKTNTKVEVARIYYRTILSKALKELNQKSKLSNDTLFLFTKSRVEAGMAELMDLNKIKMLLLDSENQFLTSNTLFLQNLSSLKLVLAIEPEQEVFLNDFNEEHISRSDIERDDNVLYSPEYYYYNLMVQHKNSELRKNRLKRLPELSAYARYTRQAQRNEFNFFESNQPWFQIGVIGLRMDFPLFTGANRNNSIKLASTNLSIAENNLKHQKAKLTKEANDLNLSKDQLFYSLENAKENYDLAGQNYKIASYKYRSEIFSADQLLQENKNLILARTNYFNKLAEYLILTSEIQIRNSVKLAD